jgi:hypothetical protein
VSPDRGLVRQKHCSLPVLSRRILVPAAGALGIGVAMAVLATLTVYELHSRKPVCCKTRTLQRWLVIGYFVFSIVTSGLAIWTLTAEATLVRRGYTRQSTARMVVYW